MPASDVFSHGQGALLFLADREGSIRDADSAIAEFRACGDDTGEEVMLLRRFAFGRFPGQEQCRLGDLILRRGLASDEDATHVVLAFGVSREHRFREASTRWLARCHTDGRSRILLLARAVGLAIEIPEPTASPRRKRRAPRR